MPGNVLQEELQGHPCANFMDKFRAPFSPCGHDDREERSHKKREPASVYDFQEIGSKVRDIEDEKDSNQGNRFPK